MPVTSDAAERERAIDEGRRLFEQSQVSINEIARLTGVPATTLRRRGRSEGWTRNEGPARENLVARLRRTVEAKIAESLAAVGAAPPQEAEKSARTLASLVRTLRELVKYDDDRARALRSEGAEPGFADLDELRRTLADRLDRMRAEDEGSVPRLADDN